MANIFVNCFNLNIGGGKNILDNYIKELNKNKLSHNYFILTPNFADYVHYSKKNLTVIDINNSYKNNLIFLKLYYYKFPKIFKKYKIDLIFNFGDIIIPSTLPQIYFFDWAYAVYDSKYIWNNMDYKNFLIRKIKVFLIKKYIKKVSSITKQNKKYTGNKAYNILFGAIGKLQNPVNPNFQIFENRDLDNYSRLNVNKNENIYKKRKNERDERERKKIDNQKRHDKYHKNKKI